MKHTFRLLLPLLFVATFALPGAAQVSWTTIPLPRPPGIRRLPFETFVTGEIGGADVVFRVLFNPRFDGAARVLVAAVETRGFAIDGIDFLPGSTDEVVCGAPLGKITSYDVRSGATLPDVIVDTDLVAAPPPGPGTWPSTVKSTPAHCYYVENQFGFGPTPAHRLMRKPWSGGPEEVVYDGGVHGLVNFEGLEIVAGRLYTFVADPGMPDKRALVSIGLAPDGLWGGMPFELHIPGLTETLGAGTDGSDELDYDPASGLLFGTNIVDGEMIAWDVGGGFEVSSPGSAHFIDGADIAASVGPLSLLDEDIDGVRSTGTDWLIVTGKGGVILSIRVPAVLADGPDDGDVRVLALIPGASFDDLTPVVAR